MIISSIMNVIFYISANILGLGLRNAGIKPNVYLKTWWFSGSFKQVFTKTTFWARFCYVTLNVPYHFQKSVEKPKTLFIFFIFNCYKITKSWNNNFNALSVPAWSPQYDRKRVFVRESLELPFNRHHSVDY